MAERYLVFLSHASSNSFEARQIASDIEKQGASVFLDVVSIPKGAVIETKILTNLRACQEFWVLVTPTTQVLGPGGKPVRSIPGSLGRPWVWIEIGIAWAWQREKKARIVLLKGLTSRKFQCDADMPVFLKAVNLVDIDDHQAYRTLLKELRGRVRSPRNARSHRSRRRAIVGISVPPR
jgi:hypothetical protein